MIRGKGEGSCTMFVAALRSSGNDAAAELFLAPPAPQVDEPEIDEVQNHTQLNQEGLDFASEMEKEMDLIQSGLDDQVEPEVTPEVGAVMEQVKPEVEPVKEEVKPEVTPTPAPRSVKVDPKPSDEKEFILREDKKEEPKLPSEVTPSIVAMNRGMFEKGGAGKKNVSFAVKKSAVPEKVEIKEEERSESPVKNLKDFFQKMSSVDKGEKNGSKFQKIIMFIRESPYIASSKNGWVVLGPLSYLC